MTAEAGHNYKFGPPKGGWPTLDRWTGKKIPDECVGTGRMCSLCPNKDMCGSCGKSGPTVVEERGGAKQALPNECGPCQAQQRPVPETNDYGDDDFGGPF